jgi:hypothetical protein
MKILFFFIFVGQFALLDPDPDPDPATQINAERLKMEAWRVSHHLFEESV